MFSSSSSNMNNSFIEFDKLIELIDDIQGLLDPNSQKMDFENIKSYLMPYLFSGDFSWNNVSESILHYCLTSSSTINSAILKSLPLKICENFPTHPQVFFLHFFFFFSYFMSK